MSLKFTSIRTFSALTPLCATALCFLPSDVYAVADPASLTTEAGSVSHTLTSPGNLRTDQYSNSAIISGNNVDVLGGESWNIVQPSQNSALLVRVNGGQPTQILGSLTANGKVMMINRAGVVFGQNAQVNVGSLVASSADIENANFNAGNYAFNKPGNADASIINYGNITTREGGFVALVAPSVKNAGVIAANAGNVVLASGDAFTVDFYGDNLFSFEVTKDASAAGKDENGNTLRSAVENSGAIYANGGRVLMTADSAKHIVDHAINTTGIVEANAINEVGGEIILDGGDGAIHVAGSLSASGKGAGQKGGTIQVTTTDNITLAAANIDASGDTQGGNINIGGAKKGGDALPRASSVLADAATTIDASGQSGDAGTVIVWSDDVTNFAGHINISSQYANGGFAEVSSADLLTYTGFTDATGVKFGTLLLDPGNWEITNGVTGANVKNAGELITQLNSANVIIDTTSAANQPGALGDITVNADVAWTGAGALTLQAENNIVINKLVRSDFRGTVGSGDSNITLNAGNDIFVNNTQVHTVTGNVTANSKDFTNNGGIIRSQAGDVTINNSEVFRSNFAKSFSAGRFLNINQNVGGSIQTVLDAIGFQGQRATVNVGDGKFAENISIGLNRVTLRSQNGRDFTSIVGTGIGSANTINIRAGVTDTIIGGGVNQGLSISAPSAPANAAAINLAGGNTNTSISGNRLFVSKLTDVAVNAINSANVSAASNLFTGNGTGLRISGAPSSFAFTGNENVFDGSLNLYVDLANNALNGSTLDASQQTFDGVRGVDMTVAEFDAARAKTNDSETVAGTGEVFYRSFTSGGTTSGGVTPPAPTADQEILDLLIVRDNAPLRNTFSFSGQTLESTPQVNNYNFNVQGVNLSLLSPAAGGAPNNGGTGNLGDLSPAAGGNQQLSSLSPSAGGNSAPETVERTSFNCVNNFLSNGFSDGTCNEVP